MKKTTQNLIANYIGKFFGVLSTFIFVPLYIKYLGFESYSVISFTLIIAGIVAIIDAGLTATLLREFARQDTSAIEKQKIYETLQIVFILLAIFSILILYTLSFSLANLMQVKAFNKEELSLIIKIASTDLICQLLFRFYLGGLNGKEKQISANLMLVAWGIIRNALVIILISKIQSLTLFFIWQLCVSFIFVILSKFILDKEVYNQFKLKLKFNKNSFNNVKSFTGGLLLISLVSAVSSQTDRILITKLLNIEILGYYTLAISLASILIVFISPISTAILPKLTEYHSLQYEKELKDTFNTFNLIISILVFSISSNLVFYAKDILYVWTNNKHISEESYHYVPFVAMGYAFIVLQTMYYQVGLAKGYIRLNNILGVINIILIIPVYYISGSLWSVKGICVSFVVIQISNFLIYAYFMNKKMIKENFLKKLIIKDFFTPFLLTMFFVYLMFQFFSLIPENRFYILVYIGFSNLFAIFLTSFIMLPHDVRMKIIFSLKSRVFKR